MPRHNMPDDWEPPVPAWSVNFGGCPSLAVDALLNRDVGVWVEAFCIPMRRFETLFSSESPAGAATRADKPLTGPIYEHGYRGGM